MSLVAHFTIPNSAFVLEEALATHPTAELRLESLVPTEGDIIPYFWVTNGAADHVSKALETSPLVEEVRTVDRTDDETLFRTRWSLDGDPVIGALRAADGALLEAWSGDGVWTLHIRFEDRNHVSTFYQTCVAAGVTPTLSALRNDSTDDSAGMGLTDPQREALEAALDSGYYAVPRETTLQELAASLGISDTALSQRLRRGLTTVLSSSMRLSPAADDSEPVDAEDEDDEPH